MTIKLTGYNLLQFPDRNWFLDKLNVAEDFLVVISDSLNPNELKCNYCGWTRIAMNLGDYVACKGKVDNIHNLNN